MSVLKPGWTLFLDRDGVINQKIENDYVKSWDEFKFLPGSAESIAELNKVFDRIIIVTNQQGIGKGIYSDADLKAIHNKMCTEIGKHQGDVCQIYYAPQLAAQQHPDRKPGIGMALRAREEFPEIDFKRSVMVGDSISDMEFGKAAGMKTVFISSHKELPQSADIAFTSLKSFADWVTSDPGRLDF